MHRSFIPYVAKGSLHYTRIWFRWVSPPEVRHCIDEHSIPNEDRTVDVPQEPPEQVCRSSGPFFAGCHSHEWQSQRNPSQMNASLLSTSDPSFSDSPCQGRNVFVTTLPSMKEACFISKYATRRTRCIGRVLASPNLSTGHSVSRIYKGKWIKCLVLSTTNM